MPPQAVTGNLSQGWSELGGSASRGGISSSSFSPREPAIAIDTDGSPIVSWTEYDDDQSDIAVAKYNPAAGVDGQWIALGNSLDRFGISDSGGAKRSKIFASPNGPIVTWQDGGDASNSIYVATFSNGIWTGLGGTSSLTGGGVTNGLGTITDYDAAVFNNRLTVTWTSDIGNANSLHAREYNGTAWNNLGLMPQISSSTTAFQPSVTYYQSQPTIAWRDAASGYDEILAQRFDGTQWQAIQAGSNTPSGVSFAQGRSHSPILRSNNQELYLAYLDDALARRAGNQNGIVVQRLFGANFGSVELLKNAAGNFAANQAADLQISFNPNGSAMFGWSGLEADLRQGFILSGPSFSTSRVFSASPSNSVQSILDSNTLGPNDAIVIRGQVPGFTVNPSDAGVHIIGSATATIAGPITINGNSVTLTGIRTSSLAQINNSSNVTVQNSTFEGGLVINNTSEFQMVDSAITSGGLRFTGANNNSLITRNSISGVIGIEIAGSAQAAITQNKITNSPTGIAINQSVTGTISQNEISGSQIGVLYRASAPLIDNHIFGNSIGIQTTIAGPTALGYAVGSGRNQVYQNQTGVVLIDADLKLQSIHHNGSGVTGSGRLGGSAIDDANVLESNAVGANIAGPIKYNRFSRNGIAIQASSNQIVAHNAIYENLNTGVLIHAKTNINLVHNTIVSSSGDMVRLSGNSSSITLTNNILWSEAGYNIYVAPDST